MLDTGLKSKTSSEQLCQISLQNPSRFKSGTARLAPSKSNQERPVNEELLAREYQVLEGVYSARALVYRKDDPLRVLVRMGETDQYVFVGGTIDPGEIAESTVIRETLEELGLDRVGRLAFLTSLQTPGRHKWVSLKKWLRYGGKKKSFKIRPELVRVPASKVPNHKVPITAEEARKLKLIVSETDAGAGADTILVDSSSLGKKKIWYPRTDWEDLGNSSADREGKSYRIRVPNPATEFYTLASDTGLPSRLVEDRLTMELDLRNPVSLELMRPGHREIAALWRKYWLEDGHIPPKLHDLLAHKA